MQRRVQHDPPDGVVAAVLERNIRALLEVRREHERRMSAEDRIAEAITGFAGSMRFVYAHLMLFGGWLLLNLGVVPGIRPWDPFPFVMLAMFASVEAIFLSTFVLISQNRMSVLSERRADLDLQISLLAEHEVTRLVQMMDALCQHLGVRLDRPADVDELKEDVRPEVVMREIESAEAGSRTGGEVRAA